MPAAGVTPAALPGFESPAAGFEQPYELLEACHERVQRSLDLLQRLLQYVDDKGHDAQTRSAAADVLRYFDLAAPLHHADEEIHVFPLLLAQGNGAQRAAVRQLKADHRRMEALWARVREPLLRWCESGCAEAPDPAWREAVAEFTAIYGAHIPTEENLVFPAARLHMDADTLADMGRHMQARRQA